MAPVSSSGPWLFPLALLVACRAPVPPPAPPPRLEPAPPVEDAVLRAAADAVARRDLGGARARLDRDRFFARDRARAELLRFDLLLLEGRTADAAEALRVYLEKTPRPGAGSAALAAKVWRHHLSGGGLAAATPEEALHFGLYALLALGEPEAARADLDRAAAEAREPERTLARLARERIP
jgi:hypothetical protein